jgi:hypothetical protein
LTRPDRLMLSESSPRWSRLLLAAAVAPALALWALLPAPATVAGDHGVKVLQARTLLEHRGWPRVIAYPGQALDPEGDYLPDTLVRVRGGVVSTFPVLFSILLALPMAAGGDWLLPIVPLLGALIAALLAGRIATSIGAPNRAVVSATALAATPLLFYALIPWEHSLATALALGSVLALVGGRDSVPSSRRWAAWGVLVGTAVWLRSELAIALAVGVITLLEGPWRRRLANAAAAGASAVAAIALGAVVQYAAIGVWLPIHLTHNLAIGTLGAPTLATRVAIVRLWFMRDALSAVTFALWAIAMVLAAFLRRRTPRVCAAAAVAAFAACCANSFLAPAVRFAGGAKPTEAFQFATATATWFFASALPAALLAWPGRTTFRRNRAIVAATACWLVVGVVGLGPNGDFYQWGVRYCLTAAPLLAAFLFATPDTSSPAARTIRWMRPAAVAGGCALQLIGLAGEYRVAWGNEALARAVAEHTRRDEVVVTDSYFVPELCERLWDQRVFFYCRNRSGIEALRRRLAARDTRSWVFTFVEGTRTRADVMEPLSSLTDGDGASWHRTTAEVVQAAYRTLHFYRYTLTD